MSEVELQQIGSYPITTTLHTGPTSTTYLSQQRKKTLLIKKFHAPLSDTQAQEAFLARAKQLKKLINRNIIRTVDASLDGEHPYLVMNYQAGQNIREQFVPGKQYAPDEVRLAISRSASALNYAHTHHVIHGNLYPETLLMSENSEILLTDFALQLPTPDAPFTPEPGALLYMAPEHLRGTPDDASDQYALAVMLYEWLCGRRPYEATERDELLRQQEETAFPMPSTLNPKITPYIEHVLVRALERKPRERFGRIQSLADNYIRALMHQPIQEATPLATPRSIPTTPLPTPVAPEPTPEEPARTPLLANPPMLQPVNKQSEAQKPAPATLRITRRKQSEAEATAEVARPAAIPHSLPLTTMASTPEPRQPDEDEGESSETARLYRQITADLCQGGVLSRRLPGYEERPAQIEMARTVARALTQNIPAIIEAGTGTGKSLAYLVPVVRSGKVAIISTANKALQEQLFYKDIPFVQKHIQPFEAALVKGVNNYLCIDRMETERVGMQFYTKNKEFQRLVDMVNDPESTFTGDFETLDFQLAGDVRGRIATDSDQCAWSKCTYFSDCYVRQMRERAERAQVIVVNHTLLLLDAAMGGFLLPERDVIILDEAHHLEEEATRSFTITISPGQVQTLLAQRMLKDHSQVSLQDDAFRAAQNMWMRLEQVADPGYKGRMNLEQPLEEGLRLASALSDLADSLRKQRPKDLPEKEGQLYDKLLKRVQNLSENVRTVFSVAETDKFVYYVDRVEGGRGGALLQASASPLDVTSWLKERLFNKCNVICTSATLATVNPTASSPEERAANFHYFRRRVGLEPEERPEVQENILPLAFDYESNSLLYLPRHLPAPAFGDGVEDYQLAIAREMYSLVRLSQGRAFLLFSSKRMLDFAYNIMEEHLLNLNLPCLKQGEMTRMELTRRFREEKGSVLFGLKSFWEGVDIAGDALSLVVIDKLPFDPPDDPVHEARVAQMKARGENWFGTYVLPQAVLRLKQGIGRLLRTRSDTGVMAILDTRLHTKGYGKLVLNALPPAQRSSNLRDVQSFFKEKAPVG
ncbi:helicase C-terminal domain-containing protein [Ktedonobacter racemifer]|uniref:Serine/threonine-protein kinase-like domain protein n=1 Tax=Ktedonobacter racemifer DSM 44963 TaxID=485913 RepID=D6TD80_KTERA|nr:helicase C-terminal domain-containing protein [Ktedonobacter racemifer]EFH90131.1 Serine/threonine-protein kinase-like domain protein [Ktedonobacter racemifer DSM 44963]